MKTMTELRFEGSLEVLRKVFAGYSREQKLKIRLAIDEALGYDEFIQKLRDEGIRLD